MPVPTLYEGIEPEWTEENINKRMGNTTFKKCGWCEHTTSGICKYDCMLRAACGLMFRNSGEFDWNDNCRYIKLSKKEKFEIVNNKLYDISELSDKLKMIEEQIYAILKEINKNER